MALLPVIDDSGALSTPKLAGLLLFLSWLATVATRRKGVRDLLSEHPGLTALLLAFLAWAGLSAFWAESSHAAFTAFARYALNISLIPIVYSALHRREHAVWIAAAFLAGASIAAAYGLVVQPNASAASGVIGGAQALNRISGTIGDPNELAAVLVASVALAVGLLKTTARAPAIRLGILGVMGFCLLAIFLTLSRGGILALGVSLLAGIFLGGRWRGGYAAIAAMAAISAIFYFGAVASPQARDRLTKADGGSGRTDIWKVGWRIVKAKPVLGVGSGNFQVSARHYVLRSGNLKRSDFIVETSHVAHNMYLHVLSELGIVGLALFLGIAGVSLRSALRAARSFQRRGDAAMELLSRSLAIALCGILAADFFLSGQYGKQLWLLLALGPALAGLAAARERAAD
jgi:O-antigen ligase